MRKLLAAVLATLCAAVVVADDGMWMPQQIPSLGPELKKLGLQVDPSRFADLTGPTMGAIVSLGGCSASFVSPDGLIVTNHHCVFGALQYNSTAQRDLVNDGFLARSREDEIQALPDGRVFVTTAIEDVTSMMLSDLPPSLPDLARNKAITKKRRQMIAECEKPGGLRCLVPIFFEGAQFLKITQLEIRDVRLVYAPPLGIGNFGDEIDNWIWPRHTGDFAFYRAYVGKDGKAADFSRDNVPYKPKQRLTVSTRDLDPGDLVFVVGTPGKTYRHALSEEVADAETTEMPASVRRRKALVKILHDRGEGDRTIALKNASRIASVENILKKHEGVLESFRRAKTVEAKRTDEAAIRTKVGSDPKLLADYDVSVGEQRRMLAGRRNTIERDALFEWLYTASQMLKQADLLYRLSVERASPDFERADDYIERERPRLSGTLAKNRRSIEPGSDRAGLRPFLLEATELPASQRIAPLDALLAATGKTAAAEQVDALLDRIYGSTRIGDAAAEEVMFKESKAQILARGDSMIAFAAAMRELGDAINARNAAYAGALSRLRPAILRGLRVARDGRVYPDANSTLRVGYGVVKGYSPRDAVSYAAQTVIGGVIQKETGAFPFQTPARFLESAAKKQFGKYTDPDLDTLPVNFASTNIVTNGSSGSPTLNAWGEVCGLAFDSNFEGVGSDYLVETDLTRTVHVDSRYMLWVMEVDGAGHLVREMGTTSTDR